MERKKRTFVSGGTLWSAGDCGSSSIMCRVSVFFRSCAFYSANRFQVLLPWTLGIIYSLVPFSLQWMTYQLDNIACDVNWNPEPAYRIYYAALFSLCFFLPALLILIQYSRIIYSIHMLKMRTPSQDGNYRSNSTNGMVSVDSFKQMHTNVR